MESSLVRSALEPPSTSMIQYKTKAGHPGARKPLAIKDPSALPEPTLERALSVREPRVVGSTLTKGSFTRKEVAPLIKNQALEKIMHDYRMQHLQLTRLEMELAEYKSETNKTIETHLLDRFYGIKKHDVMTQFSCQWFCILIVCHGFFYYCYYVLRRGSQDMVDDDQISSAKETVLDGILQVSIYSMIYVLVVFFDIFWLVLFPDRVRCERTTAGSHVIVAAHRAHASLEIMLPTVLQTFSPECIWVADNGFQDKESEALCERLGVNYEFNPIGNKANALVVVARKIKRRHGNTVKNVVLLDDDTELENDFFVRHDILSDPKVGGYCVGIAINRQPPINIWEIAIDFEYRVISHAFGARATCATMPFCHGICAVYKLDLMIEMYSKNASLPGGLPFGEDGYAGLDYRMAGYNLMQDNANVVWTYCPRRFFPPIFTNGRVQGYGASSLWKQRACRWFLSWPRQLPAETWLFFTYNAGTWYGNIQYRIYFFWWLFLNCVSVAWIPYILFVWMKHESWILVLLLKGTLTVTGIMASMLRYIAFPAKLRKGVHPLALLISPVLGFANSILRFFGFIFALYWFIPFFRINDVRVLGEEADDEDEQSDLSLMVPAIEYYEDPTETEELTDTEEYYDVDLVDSESPPPPRARRSWMELLSENLSRHNSNNDDDGGDLPSLRSYSTSSSSHQSPQR